MNTRSILAAVAIAVFSSASSASMTSPDIGNITSSSKPVNGQQALKLHGLENASLTRLPALSGYQGVNLQGQPLQAGHQVYNALTRTLGTVTGSISVLLDSGSAYDLAARLNLNVVYYDPNTKIAQLSAAGQKDILATLEHIQALPEVKYARLDILEMRNRPQ